MSTSKVKSDQPIINNGGTVVNGGAVSDGPINNPVALNEVSTEGDYGSQVKGRVPTDFQFTDTPGVIKAKESGTLAYNPQAGTNYIMRGAGDNATKVNNEQTDVLNVGGVPQKTVHKLVSTRKIGSYATTEFDLLATPSSGVAPNRTKGTGAGELSNYVSTTGNVTATDTAASSTRSNPGKITYHIGQTVNDSYTSREEAESDPFVGTTTTTTTTAEPGITLYFNAAVDNEWTELGNWWLDDNFTTQATSLPTSADDVIASANIATNSGSAPTVANFTLNDPENNGFVLIIDITVTGIATFNGGSDHGGTITGNAAFNDSALNNGTVSGSATFNGSALNYGTVGGNATFNAGSTNIGTLDGDATFNGSSDNGGTVTGNAIFNDSAVNGGGTITGNATFNGNSMNLNFVTGNATFNNSSRNLGTVTGTATFNDSACNDGGTAGTFIPDPPPSC